jgi:hypothetical protein
MLMILTLGAPAAAELAAPELPSIDAAVVRSQPFEKESIKISAAVSAERSYASRGDYALANDARAAMELAIAALKSVKGVEVIGGGVFPLPGYRFGYNIVFNSALKTGVYQYPYAFGSSDEAEEAMAGKTEELSSEGKYPFAMEITVQKSGSYSFSVAYLSGSKGMDKRSEDVSFRSPLHSSREKADTALQRILKDAKRQDIPVKNHPIVEPQGKYYGFTINFGPGMYIDKVESYGMTHSNEAMIISGIELGGGIHLETKYEAERGMSVYYVMPEGKEPQEIDAD